MCTSFQSGINQIELKIKKPAPEFPDSGADILHAEKCNFMFRMKRSLQQECGKHNTFAPRFLILRRLFRFIF